MPTATSFNALGRGNGFPFCLNKLDVSGYDLHTAWDLQTASNIYWNLNGIIGFFNFRSVESPSVDIPISNVRFGDQIEYDQDSGSEVSDTSDYSTVTPLQRVCTDRRDGQKNTGGNGFNDFQISCSLQAQAIFKYYDGNTEDESNFVGYGLNVNNPSIPLGFAYGFAVDAFVKFKHTFITTAYKSADYPPYSPSGSIVTIDNVDFVKVTIGTGAGSDITGLDFYTYS